MIELVIDNREHDLIQTLQTSNTILIEQLDVGDVLFRENGNTILVIERKTVNDLN